jgi:UDP-glucose 4-epimerase
VAQVAAIIAECWGGTVSVKYSGIVRAGDPSSLLADDTTLRVLPFDWKISVEQGFADYVSWFKDQIR